MFQLYADGHFISKFTIYGERHSGTNFLEQCIKSEFGLDITYFYGYKHFYGFAKPETISYKDRSVLFLGIVRDPYNWLSSFYYMPYHVPPENKGSFYNFLNNEWYSVHEHGYEMRADRNFTTKPPYQRYKNIFELRKHKLLYLSEIMPIIAKNYILISYESLIKNHRNYLRIISNRFGLKKIGDAPNAFKKQNAELSDEDKSVIDAGLDWSVEETLGYCKR